jgi:tetratricopeptide (TPR) repeat protein
VLNEMAMLESVTAGPMLVMVRFGRWRDVLTAQGGEEGALGETFRHYARGTAFAKLGNLAGAESERKALAAAQAKVKDDPTMSMFQNAQTAIAAIPAFLLDGRIAEARGDIDGAVAAYRKAITAEDALDYDEPADWPLPTRETLGAALLRAHRYAEAEQVFRDDLARNRHNPRSLYGLAAALRGQKKDASSPMAEFRTGWKGNALTLADY